MPLGPGVRLGPYEVIEKLGEGGMGEVFRARDTHLDRDVAIKVLPEPLAHDEDRLARFRREAHALAALNDPRIAQIYRLEEFGQSVALVMELVEGRTLADILHSRAPRSGPASGAERRPAAGPGRSLPLDEALRLAAEMAGALEAAHDRGIVHRDLKPGNIKVTPDGHVKILDFGLAKALGPDASAEAADLMQATTFTARGTEAGLILGTAAYMSPEQARGKPVDRRTDIWAFGAVLFEMVSGRRAFDGETSSDTLAAVLTTEPDWTALPADVPPHVRALIHRCLERDSWRRLRDIGEARLALEAGESAATLLAPPTATMPGGTRPSGLQRPWPWMVATAASAAAALYLAATSGFWRAPAPPVPASYELALAPPDGAVFQIGANLGNVILSPDGTKVAFVAATERATTLWVRSLHADDARSLSGTEGASYPFWSTEGRRIGFFAAGKLRTVEIAGGLPQAIADAPQGRGGSWGDDGTILFTPSGGGTIARVPATGGEATPVTSLDLSRGENAHYWPAFLPGGSRFLYFVRSTRVENSGIYLGRLDGAAPPVRLVSSLSSGVPAVRPSTGDLVLMWVADGDLLAQRLDADAAALRGEAAVIARGVRVQESQRQAYAAASRTGCVAWASARAAEVVMGLYDRDGRRIRQLAIEPGDLMQPAFSPDGRRLIFTRAEKGSADVFLHDLQTGSTERVTTDPDYDEMPTWTPDGRAIIHKGTSQGRDVLFRTVLAAGAQPSILRAPAPDAAGFETPDGRFVVLTSIRPQTGADILAQPLAGGDAIALAAAPADEEVLSMSRDGRWIGVRTDRGRGLELSVVRLILDGPSPALGAAFPLGVDAGLEPVLRSDGREVLRVTRDRFLESFPLSSATEDPGPGAPSRLFRMPEGDGTFTVSPDGSRFIVLETPYAAGQTLRVLTNWETRLPRGW